MVNLSYCKCFAFDSFQTNLDFYMKKILLFVFSFIFIVDFTNAQTTAMQLSGPDCNGVNHDLFADLDSGKVAVIYFYMSNCATCPPFAKDIQKMSNDVMVNHPCKVTGYALPYENNTTCSYSANWVSSNNLNMYAPFEKGKTQVAYYGGFGMPTVVLVGGKNKEILWSTQSYQKKDTAVMRLKMLEVLNPTSVEKLPSSVSEFKVFPNPTSDFVSIKLDLNEATDVMIDIADVNGKQVAVVTNETISGTFVKQIPTFSLANGTYLVRLKLGEKSYAQNLTIAR